MNRRNSYVQYLEELIDAGMIGNSTEAVGAGVEKGPNGEIKTWPIVRDTLTVSPMEPRMLSENTLSAIKSLSERIPALSTYLAETDAKAKTDGPEAGSAPAATVADESAEARRLLVELDIMELETA